MASLTFGARSRIFNKIHYAIKINLSKDPARNVADLNKHPGLSGENRNLHEELCLKTDREYNHRLSIERFGWSSFSAVQRRLGGAAGSGSGAGLLLEVYGLGKHRSETGYYRENGYFMTSFVASVGVALLDCTGDYSWWNE